MADSSKLSYTANDSGTLSTSNLGNINPSLTGSQIISLGGYFANMVSGGEIAYATRVDTTKLIVTPEETGSDD